MAHAVHMIGLDPGELSAVRLLVSLLRHPDPKVGELSRQALAYLQEVSVDLRGEPQQALLDHTG